MQTLSTEMFDSLKADYRRMREEMARSYGPFGHMPVAAPLANETVETYETLER